MNRRDFLALMGSTVTAVSLASCGPVAPAKTQKTLTIGIMVDARTMDPQNENNSSVQNIFRHLYDFLVIRNTKMELVGSVAESWKNVDPLTWEFKLRKGVKFHDGSDLTASDVKFTLDRITNKALNLQGTSFLATIAKTDIVDPLTVRVTTLEPDVILPNRLTFVGHVLPQKYFEKVGVEEFAKKPMGSGSYKFVEWVKDDRMVLEANKQYWGGAPKVDRLVWKPIPEDSTRMAALKTGEADLVMRVPPQEVELIKSDPKLSVVAATTNRTAFLGFDTFHPPFNNRTLRQAVNYAVDVDSIVKSVLGGYGVRTVLSPSMVFGMDPKVTPYPYDPAKAKQLMAEAGYPNGLEIQIESTPGGTFTPNDTEVVQAVAAQLEKVGIKCKLSFQEFASYFNKWAAAQVRNAYLFSFGGPFLDMDALMGGHFDSKRRAPYYNRPDLDALILEGRTTFDPQKRLTIYSKIQELIKEDAPWLFLFSAKELYGVNKRLKGWVAREDDYIELSETDVE